MRITHLCWDIASYSGGGERAVLSTVAAINRVTQSELVSVSTRGNTAQIDHIDDVPVRFIPALAGSFDNPVPRLNRLREAIAGADVIHVHQSHTMLLDFAQMFKRRRQRLVVSDYGGGGPNISRFLRRLSRVDGAVSYSEISRKVLSRICARVENIPLAIDTSRFRILPEIEVREGSVLCVGRMLPHKGFDRVIQALPPRFSLTIVGKPYDSQYVEFLRKLGRGKNVQFVTGADDKEVVQELNRAAVVVSSSVFKDYRGQAHPKTELFGLAAVEAAACGRPVVVSSAVPSLQEAIGKGQVSGRVYDWQDLGQLSDAIRGTASTKVSEKNRSYVQEHHSPDEVGMHHVAFYERLLTLRSP